MVCHHLSSCKLTNRANSHLKHFLPNFTHLTGQSTEPLPHFYEVLKEKTSTT